MDANPSVDADATTVTAIVDELTQLYLRHLDAPTRRALDAASVVRRPTLSLLARDAPRVGAAGRLRPAPPPAVRGTRDGWARHPRHDPRGRCGEPPGDGSRPVPRVPGRGMAAAPGGGRPGHVGGYLAVHRGPAVHAREPGPARRLVPDDRTAVLGRRGARREDWPAILEFSHRQYPGASTSEVEAWWRRRAVVVPDRPRRRRDRRRVLDGDGAEARPAPARRLRPDRPRLAGPPPVAAGLAGAAGHGATASSGPTPTTRSRTKCTPRWRSN